MTTYTYQGIAVNYDGSGNPTNLDTITLQLVVEDEANLFSYTNPQTGSGDILPTVDVDYSSLLSAKFFVNGQFVPVDLSVFEALFGQITWANGTTQVFTFFDEVNDLDYIFDVGGANIDLTTLAEFQSLLGTVIGGGEITSSPLRPDDTFTLGDLRSFEVTKHDYWFDENGTDDEVRLDKGDDAMFGNDGRDKLYGQKGKDLLDGGAGKDKLIGAAGKDTLYGGNGFDFLEGGKHTDVLEGGSGKDTFFFRMDRDEGDDRILDFEDGSDIIKMRNGTFEDVTIEQDGNNTIITYDTEPGTGGTILLKGIDATTITESDFEFV